MTTLEIERMSVSVQLAPGDPEDHRDRLHAVDRLLRRLTDEALARRLRAAGLPDDGEWCVRRVATTLVYDDDAPAASLEEEWADAVLAALAASLDHPLGDPTAGPEGWTGAENLLHYRHRDDAVLDLVRSLAGGRHERRWAWQQLEILPTTAADDRQIVLELLARHPHLALAAVLAVVAVRGTAGLHRLLGVAGWETVAALAAAASGVDLRRLPATEPVKGGEGPGSARAAHASALLRALSGSGLRPDQRTSRAWAVLAMLDADPLALRTGDGWQRVASWTTALCPATDSAALPPQAPPARSPTACAPPPGAGSAQPEAAATPAGAEVALAGQAARSHADQHTSVPDLPASDESAPSDRDSSAPEFAEGTPAPAEQRTAWGGLLFLLGSAERAGMPGLLEDPRLAHRDTRWLLHRLAGLLVPLAPEDPAALGLAGLGPTAPPPAGPEPTDEVLAALADVRDAWSRVTRELLALHDASPYAGLDDRAAVERVAARRAVLVGEPGWLDVVLSLDDVDVDVRVAGLDLDPGWVPWLGTVVRFRYE